MVRLLRPFLLLLGIVAIALGAEVAAAQTANFTWTPTTGCAPALITFTNTSTGTITSYSWNFGNSASSTLANPSTTYTTPGTYAVTLTVYGPGGSSSHTANITIYGPPTVSFTNTVTSGCPPLTVPFSSTVTANAPGGVSYSWNFGDGNSATNGPNTSHTYTASGGTSTYSVSLTVTNSNGCSKLVTVPGAVTVYAKPTTGISASQTAFCQSPATVVFSGNTVTGASPFSYSWTFGNGGTNNTTNTPTYTYNAGGTYTVQLITTDANGCKDTNVQANYIKVHTPAATFTAPTNVCLSVLPTRLVPASFTNTTTPSFGSTSWNFGDGNSDTGATTMHSYTTTGTYTVRMVTLVDGCYDTATSTIVVNPYPATGFSWSPNPNCPPPNATLTFTPTASTSSYLWQGRGWSSTSGSPSRTYNTVPYYDTVRLITTSAAGCSDTGDWTVVPVFDASLLPIGLDHGCAPLTVRASVTVKTSIHPYALYPSPIASVVWDWGDGSTGTGDTITHVYPNVGTYRRILIVTTANGCVLRDTTDIHVGSPVKPSFTIMPDSVCVHVPVHFHNTTVTGPGAVIRYTWDVGQAYSVVNGRDAVTAYVRPHTYDITLYADSNGCVDSTTCYHCLTILPSNANFRDSIFCRPLERSVQFIDSSIGATSYNWSFGDSYTSTASNPLHTYASYGPYNVRLITSNSTYGCRDTLTITVNVTQHLIDFAALDNRLCKDDTTTFYPATTGYGGIDSAVWLMDGAFQKLDSTIKPWLVQASLYSVPMHPRGLFTTVLPGLHTISYVIASNLHACHDTVTKPDYLFISQPTANFGATSLLGCTPLFVTLRDSSMFTPGAGPATRNWTFGDGTSASNNTLTTGHTYTSAGVYNVRLIVTDSNGCVDSMKRNGYIEARHPSARFAAQSTNSCVGIQVQFNNNSTGKQTLHFAWDFGDGATSTATAPAHAYTASGSYNVRLIVTDTSGCVDTLVKPGYISITRPAASFNLDDSLAICPPLSVHFNSTSVNAATYAWDFANGNSSTIATPAASYSAPGVYNVRLIAFDAAGCPDTAFRTVRVLGYAGAFSYTPLSGCHPLTVSFTSTITTAPTLIWDFSDGDTALATGPTITHTYLSPGAYVPKILFTDGTAGCRASSTGLDTIKVDGVRAGFKALPPCEKSTIQLVDTSFSYFSPKVAWAWKFDNGQTASGASVPHFYPAAGTYPVTLIVANSRGCKDTLTQNVVIYPLPVITASADTAVCVPDAAVLSASGGISYTWSPAGSLSCAACATPAAAPTVPTAYVVTGTDAYGCANRDTVKVGIQTKTTFNSVANGEICLGQHYTLSATGAMIYAWSPPESLDDPQSPHPSATPKVNTTYMVVAKEGSCIADTHFVKVVVHPLPTAYAGEDAKMIAGRSTILQASGQSIHHLAWTPDSTLSCGNCYAPEARPKTGTTYVLHTYTEYGCEATDSVRVIVLCDGSQLFIPNTFTPNSDGQNDFFFPRGQGVATVKSMRVYNRWGEKVYEVTDLSVNDERRGWDGSYNGRMMNPDTYVYIIEATCDNGDPINWKGDVTLIR